MILIESNVCSMIFGSNRMNLILAEVIASLFLPRGDEGSAMDEGKGGGVDCRGGITSQAWMGKVLSSNSETEKYGRRKLLQIPDKIP